MRSRTRLSLAVLVAALALSCGGRSRTQTTAARPPVPRALAGLFDRLAPPTVSDDGPARLVLRAGPPVPQPGETRMAFPAPQTGATPPAPPAGAEELRVLGMAPNGEDTLVGAVRVTFSEPMVPLAALSDIAATAVPVRITPQIPGKFRWLGTQTVVFEPANGRAPMATEYTVDIPAGTQAVGGAVLERAVHFRFQTPAPRVIGFWPSPNATGLSLDQTIGLHFDQRIDPRVIAAGLRFTAAGAVPAPTLTVISDPAEIARLESKQPHLATWHDERRVFLRPAAPLAKGTAYTVRLPAGTMAAEGPRPTSVERASTFRTYGPLRVEGVYCTGGEDRCRPGQSIYIAVSNGLVPQDLDALVTVTPDVPGLTRTINGAALRLGGDFAPATTYRVVVAAALRDRFTQTLSADHRAELRFGDSYPNADVQADRLATIETASPHLLPVGLTNVRGLTARIAAVPESKMRDALRAVMQGYGWSDRVDPFVSAGLVASPVGLRVRGARNVAERVGVDLAAPVPAGQTGMALVEVRAPQRDVQMRELRLVQITDLGLVATLDTFGGYARVTSLARGTPVGGVRVQVFGTSATPVAEGTTESDGTVRLRGEMPGGQLLVTARTAAGDRALLQTSVGSTRPMLEGQVLSERDPYRPGDTVHLRVVVREHLDDAVASLVTPSNLALRCSVRDAHYAEKAMFEARLSAYGTAAHDVELPRDASTGQWRVTCSVNARSSQISGAFRVEEYRAPEIAVHVLAPTDVKLRGDTASMTVESDYLFGADAAGLPVSWTVGRERTSYAPPGHADFLFGDHASWGWRSRIQVTAERRYGRARPVYRRDQSEREIVARGEGVLDAQGRLVVPIELDPGEIDDAARFTLEAEVTDTSRQSVAGRASVIAHPGTLYAGLRLARSFASERDPILVDALVTDVPGVVRAGRTVSVRAVEERSRLVPQQVAGDWVFRWETVSREVGKCELRSAAEPVQCRIAPQRPGSYVVEAIVRDDAGHVQTSRASVWIYGAGYVPYGEGTETITLLPEKETVVAGETARLLVRTPFSGGRGILTIERNGIVEARALDLDGSVQAIEVQVPEAYVPSFTVRVALARGRASDAELAAMLENAGPDALQAAAEDVGRPTWGTAAVTLKVDDRPKRLDVVVTPEHTVRGPGEHLGVSVEVKDAQGRPTDAEVSVVVVDEAVLQLLAYETPDPVAILHRAVRTTARTEAVHAHIVRRRAMRALAMPRVTVSTPEVRGAARPSPRRARGGGGDDPLGGLDGLLDGAVGGGGRAGGAMLARARPAPTTVTERSRGESTEGDDTGGEIPVSARGSFATTAFYTASVITDAAGKARVEFDLPDNLTTFRIMAVAIARDDRSGSGQSTVQVRKPLLLRPALPRFATFGDRFEANVIVHNETGEESEVLVGMRAAGIVVEGDGFVRLRLAAGTSQEVSFPVRVEAGRGKARVQFAASAAHGSDAVELDLPLAEPATAEAFATYGSLTEGAVRLPLRVPTGVVERFGGLEVRLSSTALTGLDEAADYLIDYPYLCAEQHGARLVAAAALRDILGEGRNAQGVARADRIAADAIAGVAIHQRGDGGFVYWPRMRNTELYVSAWVVFALGEAKRAGHTVPTAMLTRGLSFLEQRVRYPRHDLGEDEAWAAQAFALLVLGEAGRVVPPNVLDRVYAYRADMPVFGQAWLESALRTRAAGDPRAADIWRTIENAAVETAEGAHFAEARVESARLLWHSERRTDAIVLSEMLSRTPDHPLVEKTARALIAARRNGVWANTQENAWALSALVRYFRAREAVVPDFEATAWLGTQVAFSQPFRGRDGTVAEGRVSMAELIAGGDTDLVVAPTGVGRLYYRLGLRYAPTELRLPPAEQGFTVTRTYEPLGDATNVRRDDDGVWHVALGADLRVRVTLIVPDDRYDVAVDDPLPAGFEATNMAFDTTATQRLSGERDERRVDFRSYWALWAFDHRELRDDRTVAFARHAPAGVYELTYLAKATTPGRFVATATHVEEMYAPETFGRAGTDIVVVER